MERNEREKHIEGQWSELLGEIGGATLTNLEISSRYRETLQRIEAILLTVSKLEDKEKIITYTAQEFRRKAKNMVENSENDKKSPADIAKLVVNLAKANLKSI